MTQTTFNIATVGELMNSMQGDIAYLVMGKYKLTEPPEGLSEANKELYKPIDEVLASVGYRLVHPENDVTHESIYDYSDARIERLT